MATCKLALVCFLSCFLCLFLSLPCCNCCGTSTHIEISHRAQDGFYSANPKINFGKLLLKHQDALEGGSPYPDSFYDAVCFGGKYHNVSETTHWTPFMNATINYIRKHYPPPWDEGTEKLVVFLLGVVSHQTADVSWHGLGIDQGFLDAMAAINFHGSFDTAHPIGDMGGDIMTMFQLNTNYMPYFTEWYVPVDDLYNIYTELYGSPVIPKYVIEDCTLELYAERIGEKLAGDKLYGYFAKKSPFLVDQLTDYFLGGLDDMAVWSQNVWRKTILMLEQGTEVCKLDHNPLYIQCKGDKVKLAQKSSRKPERNGYFLKRTFTSVTRHDVIMKRHLRGVTLHPGYRVQEALKLKQMRQEKASVIKRSKAKQLKANQKSPDAVYSVNNTYAKLGRSMAVADLDGDGNDDVVIGAPGYRHKGCAQNGAVFILFGTDQGLPLLDLNLEKSADVILRSPECVNGRLGSAVTIVDINQDGILDVAAGAPSTGSSALTYGGSVLVFYGDGQRNFLHNMTVICHEHYCNLGKSLAAADLTGDGFQDLLIGAPFSGAKGDQRGLFAGVLSSSTYSGHFVELNVSYLDWQVYGRQNYSWYGSAINTKSVSFPAGDFFFILVAGSSWRSCALPSCSYSERDKQQVGKLEYFESSLYEPVRLRLVFDGMQALQKWGSVADVGRPLPGGAVIMAVGVPGDDVAGSIADIRQTFAQTGSVWLEQVSPLSGYVASFHGDRRYSRFGSQLKFSDINGDGFDDLIIGAPLRTDDITEEIHAGEEGAAYVYYGGPSFLNGSSLQPDCPALSLVTPCPEHTASVVFTFNEDKARFGSQFAVVKTKTKVDVLVTALHSSRGARLSGAIAVYSFPRK